MKFIVKTLGKEATLYSHFLYWLETTCNKVQMVVIRCQFDSI